MKKLFGLFIGLAISLSNITAQSEKISEKDNKSSEEKKEKYLKDVVKSCHVIPGLFTIYQDSTSGKSYLQIHKNQLDKEFIHFFHIENGAADAGWVRGKYGWESLFKFERNFDKIQIKAQNANYYFDPSSPLSKSSDSNINEPIIGVSKIVAESMDGDSLLIESDGLFLSEAFVQIKYLPGPNSKAKNPFSIGGLSRSKSHIDRIRSYPANSDWLVTYVYENNYPTNFGRNTITDPRYTSIQVQHSFVEMPDNDYEPRYDDPRVGYFTSQVTDQTSISPTPYRDMIKRWDLKKKNPELAISEPIKPIVFWMENTTPTELRPLIKEAGERWNRAFEKAGFKNAFIINQQPDDADWDAGDLRYNMLRWTSAPYTGSAWGPNFANPRTGQILGSDIMFDYIFIKGRTTFEELYSSSSASLNELMFPEEENKIGHKLSGSCNASHHMQQKFLFGHTAAVAMNYDKKELSRMLDEYITQLVLHEIGHVLGLNHNFKASHLWSPDEINNKAVTQKVGLTSSVMDYSSFNITGNPETQGQYMTTTPGPYDLWAIEYGYAPKAETEQKERDRMTTILNRSTEKELAFGNDADDMRSPGKGIDPTINVWDLTSDVMAFGQQRVALCQKTLDELSAKLINEGESYEAHRIGYYITLNEYFNALNVIGRYIGGVEIDRAMAGQQGEKQPFTPIPYQKQIKAMEILRAHAFSPNSFRASKKTYTYLQKQRRGFGHFRSSEDPKIHSQILNYQKRLLAHLMHPTVLARITNSGLYGNSYSVDLVLSDLTKAIFESDLKGNVNTTRRNLQVEYVKGLLSGLTSGPYDHVAKASLLSETKKIAKWMKSAKTKNKGTQSHRDYINYLINETLKEK